MRRFDEAITAHQDATAIHRETGDRHGESLALGGLGRALDEAGRSREAMTAYQDAIAIYRETGDQYREAILRENLDRPGQRSSPEAAQRACGPLSSSSRLRAAGGSFPNLAAAPQRLRRVIDGAGWPGRSVHQ